MDITEEEYERYPFIKPRDGWYGATEIPQGWHDTIMLMCEQIKQFLITNNIPIEAYHCNQGKEKWGSLEWYDTLDEFPGAPDVRIRFIILEHIDDLIINHYKRILRVSCTCCGKPATMRKKAWIEPLCDECYRPIQK